MAKTIAPLMSFDGAGQIAKSLVFSRWRGIAYTRRYVVPANPNTQAQGDTRGVFSLMAAMWKLFPALAQAPWIASAVGRPFLGVNKFTGDNIRAMRPAGGAPVATDLSDAVFSPGALGGPAPGAITPTLGATTITLAIVAPTLPAGWTIVGAQGVLVKDQDPTAAFLGLVQTQEDLTSTYSLAFTGLITATEYAVGVWFKYLRPDGRFAYSVGVTHLYTTT